MLRVKVLENCDFPIVQKEIGAFKVLVIPPELLALFEGGCHAVRICSAKAATLLPDFGGGTAQGRSQVPHQDHAPWDRRRFLAFSKLGTAPRGSATYLVHPDHMQARLDWFLAQFEMRREEIRRAFSYRPPYMISKEDLYRCLEPGGLDQFVAQMMGNDRRPGVRLYLYSGILAYLLQDRFGDGVVEMFLKENEGCVWVEQWDMAGLLIVDNSRTFHGRRGPNVPLKRNWLVAS